MKQHSVPPTDSLRIVPEVLPWALILAAGQGTRMAQATDNIPKQFLPYRGAPLYWRSALTMSSSARVEGIIFVFPQATLEEEASRLELLDEGHYLGLPWRVVAGGEQRQDSVRHGLAALPSHCDRVLVHDAARPFASAGLINRLCDALKNGSHAVIPGIPVNDTIKVVENGVARHTPDRSTLRAVQTPQAFSLSPLRSAHEQAQRNGWVVTDDASLLERCGYRVNVIDGEPENRKLTTPEDLHMLDSARLSAIPRTGFGYDVHRFAPGRPLRLGGVAIPGGLEVQAHSDGDVLLHALMDAILGCAAAGDIGKHFPDSSANFDNIDSAILLDEVLRMAQQAGLRLVHADLTIITQKPRITPHRDAIRANIARLLGLPGGSVNVKATTEEGLGFTGAGEGIKAVALVTALHTIPQ